MQSIDAPFIDGEIHDVADDAHIAVYISKAWDNPIDARRKWISDFALDGGDVKPDPTYCTAPFLCYEHPIKVVSVDIERNSLFLGAKPRGMSRSIAVNPEIFPIYLDVRGCQMPTQLRFDTHAGCSNLRSFAAKSLFVYRIIIIRHDIEISRYFD